MFYDRKCTGSRRIIYITILPRLLCPATHVKTNSILPCKAGQPCPQTHALNIEETTLCGILFAHNEILRTQLGDLCKIRITLNKCNRIDISRPCITAETYDKITSVLMSQFQELSPMGHSLQPRSGERWIVVSPKLLTIIKPKKVRIFFKEFLIHSTLKVCIGT